VDSSPGLARARVLIRPWLARKEQGVQYLFEDYVLDIERHELRKADAVLSVEPQVFDLLACLIRHRDRVVSRDELLASVWEGRNISDSTFTSRINAARAAIYDSGEDQRLIRTVHRRGYRFVGSAHEQEASTEVIAPARGAIIEAAAALPGRDVGGLARAESTTGELAPVATLRLQAKRSRVTFMLFIGALVGAIMTTLMFLLWPGGGTWRSKAASVQKFDASVVPLVTDEVRRTLAGYVNRPDAKAVAIAREGWSIVDGASDSEAAKHEALRQCAGRAKGVCRIYAVGMDVVWSSSTLPLPALRDIRSEPLQAPLVADEIPILNSQARRAIAEGHIKGPNHKALAITTRGGYLWMNNLPTRGESVRLAVERCAELTQLPCLLLAVDEFLTIQIPKSRRLSRIFLPSTEAEISVADRERIGRIYQGDEWRALARGKKGTWHPVAAASSEVAAIERALELCSQADEECRLYAIGNFRVADDDGLR